MLKKVSLRSGSRLEPMRENHARAILIPRAPHFFLEPETIPPRDQKKRRLWEREWARAGGNFRRSLMEPKREPVSACYAAVNHDLPPRE